MNVVVDDHDATVVRGPFTATAATDAFGGVAAAGSGDGGIVYAPVLPRPDTYDVYATWPAATGNSPRVVYRVTHAGGVTDVEVDQRAGGNRWNDLGAFDFAGDGSATVEVFDADGVAVVADAVRFAIPPVCTTCRPEITSPAPGTVLSGASATFEWTANGRPVEDWWLHVGSTPGASDVHDSEALGAGTLARTVSGIPTDGRAIWVRLSYRDGGAWVDADFQYTAAAIVAMTAPAPGSELGGSEVTFGWSANGAAVTEWWLYVGSGQGTNDLHDSGSLTAGTLSRTVSGLPTDGRTVWVQLWYVAGGTWYSDHFSYTASGG